ncbi:nucleolin-like [Diaphorina citri]|uniref:Nucleolin-like n=1 Tax=Diaphorina citri TaxID=121845 RepID=A0A3Q0J317_DIACI|nr:nucleolin-like [Diaphorina citri]
MELDEIIRSKQSSFEVSADTIIDEVPEGFLDSAKNSFDQDSGSVDEKLNVNNTIKELLTLVNSPRDDQSLSPGDGKSLTPERRSSQSLTPDRKSSTSITPERRSSGTPERRPSGTPERRSSTRQERLDSFKKLKNFSMDIWNSDEVEKNINPEDKPEDEFDEDDDAFLPPDEPPGKVEETLPGSGVEVKGEDQQEEPEAEEAKDLERPEDDRDLLSEINKELLEVLNVKDIIFEVRTPVNIPEKRSFDEEPSTSSYGKQFPLESSGSSSLDEVNLPVDDNDETCELDEFPTNIAYPTHAELMLSNFNSNTYLNRTLSRISERSTTSEQERSDFEDLPISVLFYTFVHFP